MKLLLIPSSDWVHHPTRSRLHYIFENLAHKHQVNVLWFRQKRWNDTGRKTNTVLRESTKVHSRDLSLYYLLNWPNHSYKIASIVKKESIDVIVYANIIAGSCAVKLGSSHSVPVICDYLDHYPESARAYYANRAVGQLVSKVVSIAMGWNVRNSTMNVAISDSFRRILVQEYGVRPERVAVIPNGVDTTVFAPIEQEKALQKLGLSKFGDFLCLCYAGAVESWSGIEIVANAVDRLNQEGVKVALFIVGGGLGTNFYRELRSRFTGHPNFVFTGFVSEEKVALYMCAAHICVLPSRPSKLSAGLPLKLLEYLACRKPVLSTRIPEVVDSLEDIVTTYGSSQELGDILRSYNKKADFSAQLDKGCEFALHRSWENISRTYENLLEHMRTGVPPLTFNCGGTIGDEQNSSQQSE